MSALIASRLSSAAGTTHYRVSVLSGPEDLAAPWSLVWSLASTSGPVGIRYAVAAEDDVAGPWMEWQPGRPLGVTASSGIRGGSSGVPAARYMRVSVLGSWTGAVALDMPEGVVVEVEEITSGNAGTAAQASLPTPSPSTGTAVYVGDGSSFTAIDVAAPIATAALLQLPFDELVDGQLYHLDDAFGPPGGITMRWDADAVVGSAPLLLPPLDKPVTDPVSPGFWRPQHLPATFIRAQVDQDLGTLASGATLGDPDDDAGYTRFDCNLGHRITGELGGDITIDRLMNAGTREPVDVVLSNSSGSAANITLAGTLTRTQGGANPIVVADGTTVLLRILGPTGAETVAVL
jgi:hypothetical protein